MKRNCALALFVCLACGASYWAYAQIAATLWPNPVRLDFPDDPEGQTCAWLPVSVPNNRGPEIVDGFSGEVHPLLHRPAQTEVSASWLGSTSDILGPQAPLELRQLYINVKPAVPTYSYSERDFSAFLPPENVSTVGKAWAVDIDAATVFLKQFHPSVSTHYGSVGRRPGPDGTYALLRGLSPSHVDVVFRVHAQFDLLPPSSDIPALNAWYTPAYFLGRLVVNRQAGTVEYFRLAVPTENPTNLHVTWWSKFGGHAHTTHRVDRMELVGGSDEGLDGIRWTDEIDLVKANDMLATIYYKHKNIHFVPFEQTLATAKAQKKPILAVVQLGALDDQSC
jgi:hypothetical protein